MANKSGTNVASAITTFTDSDAYATAYANEIQGGRHSVATLVGRNAIFKARRKVGMTCYVEETESAYKLITNPITDLTLDSDWELDIPTGDTIIVTGEVTLNNKLNTLETELTDGISDLGTTLTDIISDVEATAAERYIMFCLEPVKVGVDAIEQMMRFNAKIVSIAANVPTATVLTNNIVAHLECYSEGVWGSIGELTILSSDATKSGITLLATPIGIAIGSRLRINVISTQEEIESLVVAVGIQLTK